MTSPVWTASPCGGLDLDLAGRPVTLCASGALWMPEDSVLVVGDLHLEKGSAYARRGQLLPPYDTRETLGRLSAEVGRRRPKTVILLGDSFHDDQAEARLAPEDARDLADLAQGRILVWVTGNHDEEGPRQAPGEVVADLSVAGLCLRHEPEAGLRPGEVSGHLHPCARISGPRGRVRRRCFATDGQRLILPAFGAYAGGLNLLDPAFGGLFSQPPLAGVLGTRRVHAVGRKSLCPD